MKLITVFFAAMVLTLTQLSAIASATDAPLSAGFYGGWVEEPMIVGLQGRYNF